MGRSNGKNGKRSADGREYTGRTLVLLAEGATSQALGELENRTGIRVRSLQGDASALGEAAEGNVSFEQLGVAVVESDPEQAPRIAEAVADRASPILATEPERVVFAISLQAELIAPPQLARPNTADGPSGLLPPGSESASLIGTQPVELLEFLRGYRAAVSHLHDLVSSSNSEAPASALALEAMAAHAAWGLSATKVSTSRFTGAGIRVAVLDTGFDLHHPDFAERAITSASFVRDELVQDGNGHGTHCIGTACGPHSPTSGVTRYGVASAAEIYAGKVLSNEGSGTDAGILAGIDWAVANRCAIISMSLGAPTTVGDSYSQIFETVAQRAAAKGTIIIAAAGNESERPYIAPVSHPANCPSIVAVGAVDERLRIAPFSCGGLSAGGGEVNVAAPGVNILSAWPMPARIRSISGTSMATPHVAGIAALYAEATRLRGFALMNAVLQRSRRLSPVRDFGWGLVQSA